MSQPQEKALKTFVVGESGVEVPLGVGSAVQESDSEKYIESKRTWKSYFWSSEPPYDTRKEN
jgi:ACS family pantothenate transporter-like MFS transporter